METLLVALSIVSLDAIQSQSVPTGPFLRYSDIGGKPYTVESDARSWIINGKRTILLGGSVHYPRLSPGQWKPILTKMLEDGLNHAEVYVFWNIHEPQYNFSGQHVYNYKGRANLTLFLETAKEVGIFINLRIGPYVCAEWSGGGLPAWLLHVPGISYRNGNEPWENEMQSFIEEIKSVSVPYLAKNGGPIILAQIENEYHGSGQNATDYVNWCGELTTQLDMNISWVMCNGESANNTINTCNGNDCYDKSAKTHAQQYPGQPMGWTENEGWFQSWTGSYNASETAHSNRAPQDMANVIAMWFAAGAAHHNYYMWYGGNHVSWTAGSGITNFYADGVNLHGDGLSNEPKKSHLMRLHNIISEYGEYPLMETPPQVGNELPLTDVNTTITYNLMIQPCDSNKGQLWDFNASTGILRAIGYGNSACAQSTGKSDPVTTASCNPKDKHQKWTYNSDKEFQSTDNSCLDVYANKGPNVEEFQCKDSQNQQWIISGSTIKSVENGQCLTAVSPPPILFAYEYHSTTQNKNMTFICNVGKYNASGTWKGKTYVLIPSSVIILDTDNNILYNTAVVNTTGLATKRIYNTIYNGTKDLKFSSWTEILPLTSNPQNRSDQSTTNKTPLEQIRFTNNTYEYLIYSTEFAVTSAMTNPRINITGRQANAYIIYIDNKIMGQAWDGSHSKGADMNISVVLNGSISNEKHTLTIVSSSLGIANGIAIQQPADAQDKKGIVGEVLIGNMNLTENNWSHWIGRTGEVLDVAGNGMSKVQWITPYDISNGLTWYRATFITPSPQVLADANSVILVDIGANGSGFKRGHWFLNGMDMGHYNNFIGSNELMMQQYYFVPNDYLTPNKGENTLVFAEELDNVNPIKSNIVSSTFVVP